MMNTRARGSASLRRPARWQPAIALAIVFVILAGCASYEPLTPPRATLPRDVSLSDRGDYLAIAPVDSGNETYEHGIIFYPGGLVQPEAYVSLLAPLAERGVPIAISRVPFNLAVFGADAAAIVLDDRFGALAETWTLAGHSLGGAMAARFVSRRRWDYESVRGLILLAAYPADSDPLGRSDVEVLSIWASNDGLATAEDREQTRGLLPGDTRYHVIEGGNHAGFGEYGPQDGDGELEISREEQHREVRELIVGFLAEL